MSQLPDVIRIYQRRGLPPAGIRHDRGEDMNFSNRLFWFSRNLLAFILMLIAIIPHELVTIVLSAKCIFITNGSEVIYFPWEWEWFKRRRD